MKKLQSIDCCEKISVIIPVYNTEKYIDRCLKSVLANTYQNIEVICVDDGSTDSSYDILKGYAEIDKRIKVIKQKNAGVSAARNIGLAAITGEFVTFVDSDDWIHPQCLEILHFFLKKENVTVSCCKWECVKYEEPVFEDINVKKINHKVVVGEDILKDNVAKRLVCAHLYSTSFIYQHHFDVGLKNEEDIFFNISLFCKRPDMRIAVVDKELYFYYYRISSASHTNEWSEKIKLAQKYLECFERNPSEEAKKVFLREACKSILAVRYGASFLPEYKKVKKECKKIIRIIRECMKTNVLNMNQRIVFNMFFEFPLAYRLFRIVDDPTLLDWENSLKEQSKEI